MSDRNVVERYGRGFFANNVVYIDRSLDFKRVSGIIQTAIVRQNRGAGLVGARVVLDFIASLAPNKNPDFSAVSEVPHDSGVPSANEVGNFGAQEIGERI
jgi:hypothetical protein